MGKHITLDTDNGSIDAYLAKPNGTPKGGIVVIQEIFGVNGHIRDVADRFAAQGYTAIAPALFDHAEKGVELGYDEHGMKAGMALVEKVGMDKPIADVKAAAAYIADAGKVGTVGFCWGGTVAYLSAARLGLPSVSYYGGSNAKFADEKAKAPVIFHYGAKDDHISADDRAKVQKANPDAPIYLYENAGHGFNCDRRDSYDEGGAKQAMERTLAFFEKNLG